MPSDGAEVVVEPHWVVSWESAKGRRRYQRLGDAVWYQVRLGCQECIDSGFVMSVIPSTSSVLVPSRVGSVVIGLCGWAECQGQEEVPEVGICCVVPS